MRTGHCHTWPEAAEPTSQAPAHATLRAAETDVPRNRQNRRRPSQLASWPVGDAVRSRRHAPPGRQTRRQKGFSRRIQRKSARTVGSLHACLGLRRLPAQSRLRIRKTVEVAGRTGPRLCRVYALGAATWSSCSRIGASSTSSWSPATSSPTTGHSASTARPSAEYTGTRTLGA